MPGLTAWRRPGIHCAFQLHRILPIVGSEATSCGTTIWRSTDDPVELSEHLCRDRLPWPGRCLHPGSCGRCGHRRPRPRCGRFHPRPDRDPGRPRDTPPRNHDRLRFRADLLRPGHAPELRVQPSGGGRVVREGDLVRFGLRHVLLGNRLGQWPQHQRGADTGGRGRGAPRCLHCAEAVRWRDGARARLHPGHGAAVRG